MSHVTTVNVKINDLEALKAACKELGVIFVEGKATYKWYGHYVGDYKFNVPGLTVADLGKCTHVIQVPGVSYEVGVVQRPDGTYTLLYDFWGPGRGLLEKFGPDCQKLVQMYAKHAAINTFTSYGYAVEELPDENGVLQLAVTKGY